MNKTKRIAFGIGMVLAVLAVLIAPAAADAVVYFEPDPSTVSLAPGENITIQIMADVDATESGIKGFQLGVDYDPSVVNMTFSQPEIMPPWVYWWMGSFGGSYYPDEGPLGAWFWIMGRQSGTPPCYTTMSDPPLPAQLANLTIEGVGPGTSPLRFTFEIRHEPTVGDGRFYNCTVPACRILPENITWINNTITCVGEAQTFEKNLVEGWNLISMPLTADDMTVVNVIDTSLSGSYDGLYKYDATTHRFVSLSTSDTMENGVGYFINMSSDDTWTYSGSASNSMNAGLSDGLNMVGWLNCSKDIVSDEALSSIEGNYYYVARWNAATKEFETYNPVAPDGFDDFAMMDRGEGYFISMKIGDTLEGGC